MNKKFVWLSILGVILSFVGGFFLANALNRGEISSLTAENARLKKNQSGQTSQQSEVDLSDKEIQEKIAEAKKNPKDFAFQKGLGLGLYRYAMLKQDKDLLVDVSMLLQRANDLNPDDYDVIVSLGNVYFDLGQIEKDKESNLKARKLYQKALEKNPKDVNVRTDFGLTYLLTEDAEIDKAIGELEKSLELNSKHEKTLQFLTQAKIKKGNLDEAEKYLAKLKEINPKNQGIADLEGQIKQNK